MSKEIMILLLGKSLQREDGSGILPEALKIYPDREVWVVKSNRERLVAPEGYECITVAEAAKRLCGKEETQEWDVVLVANGGQTAQVVPLVVALCSGYEGFWGVHQIVNLQRDGVELLAEERFVKSEDSTPLEEATEDQVRWVWNNTPW